jgi:hypothetical protein
MRAPARVASVASVAIDPKQHAATTMSSVARAALVAGRRERRLAHFKGGARRRW